MSFKFDASKLISGIAEKELKSKAALGLYGDTVAKKMENHAKSNYPWTDRTHQASRRLKSNSKWMGNTLRIELSHGVSYGIYLEFCNEKKYAILKPSIDAVAPSAIRGLQNLLK